MALPPLVGAGGRPVVGRWHLCGRRGVEGCVWLMDV